MLLLWKPIRAFCVLAAVAGLWAALGTRTFGQLPRAPLRIAPEAIADLRQWDTTVDRMVRAGELRPRRTPQDTLLPGRTHERFDQYHRGVRVFGADLTRQLDGGLTVSIFGTLYSDIDVDTNPRLSVDDAREAIGKLSGGTLRPGRLPELVIFPTSAGAYALTYTAEALTDAGPVVYFVDARTGDETFRYTNRQSQAAVRAGLGVLGDAKKVSMLRSAGGPYLADDYLRPPVLRTYDMRANITRTIQFLNAQIGLTTSDVASTTADVWADGAAVDAQVYQGWTYDYYYKRFGRRGLDNSNVAIRALVHTVRQSDAVFYYQTDPNIFGLFFVNAFYLGDGFMVYGEGLPSTVALNSGFGFQRWNYLSGALDVVCHELSHGVTDYTSGLIYLNESGALNEAFSDMMGASCEFYFASARGKTGNYLLGEDVITSAAPGAPNGLRSMADPLAYGDPDHYSIRNRGSADNGGVHTNSGIGNNMFYLAIEGGRNRTSALSVSGVGSANREQIEKTIYRGFTLLMPSNATFSVARSVTIQAARDLYGAGSAAATAVTQAWTAVGVN